jgi:hypothetical protein
LKGAEVCAVSRLFTTFFGQIPSVRGREDWEGLIEQFRSQHDIYDPRMPRAQRRSLKQWGEGDRSRYSYDSDTEYAKILAPAGSPSFWNLDGDRKFFVRCSQIEVARYGLPDLFEASLMVNLDSDQGCRYLSEIVPAHSESEACERFRNALSCSYADALANLLVDDLRIRAFGVAASPDCLKESLDAMRVPTSSEIQQALGELRAAVEPLRDVLQKWAGSDALEFIQRNARSKAGRRGFPLGRFDAVGLSEDLTELAEKRGEPGKRRGRPIKGGKENALVLLLSRLWQRCGLGEPKYSPQSRFIRACSVVLPWHGVHKADVSQFVRGEIKKERSPYSSRGYVLNG